MRVVILVVELKGKDPSGLFSNVQGKYIAHIGDIDNPCTWRLTDNVEEANVFEDLKQAYALWGMVSRSHPWRLDGKPNRPLTSFSVLFKHI